MSSASVTSNKREKDLQELKEELEAVRHMNSSLQAYMEQLRTFKRNLSSMNNNCKQLGKVNSQWIDMIGSWK